MHNGHTEQGNPPVALGGGRSTEQGTTRMPQTGEIACECAIRLKQRPQGKLEDTLTWARTIGR